MPAEYVVHAGQWALAAVFLAATVGKLRDPAAFVRAVDGYRLLPRRVVPAVAWGLVGAEAFLAVTLFTGWLFAVAVPLAVLVLGAFLAAVVVVTLRRGRRVRCGCFGGSEELLSRRTVARLGLLVGVALLVLVLDRASAAGPLTVGEIDPGDGLLVAMLAAFGLLVGTWLLVLPELATALRWLIRPPGTPAATTRDEV